MGLKPPLVNAVVNYAYTIISNGLEIGTLQRLTVNSERNHQVVKEVKLAQPNSVEVLLDRATYTLEVEKVQMYTVNVLQAFGFVYATLGDVVSPVIIYERLTLPEGFNTLDHIRGIDVLIQGTGLLGSLGKVYIGCVPIRSTKTIDLGKVLVTESATFACVDILDLSLPNAVDTVSNLFGGLPGGII